MGSTWKRIKSGLQWSWSLDDSSLQNIIWHFTIMVKATGLNMNVEMTKHGINFPGIVLTTLLIISMQIGILYAIVTWNDHRRIDAECIFVCSPILPLKVVWLFWKSQDIMELLNMALNQNLSLNPIEEVTLRKEMKVTKWRCRTFIVAQTSLACLYQYIGLLTGITTTSSFPILYPGMEDENIYPNNIIYYAIRQILLLYNWVIILSSWMPFVAIMGHACGHAKAISAEVSTLKSTDEDLTSRLRYVAKRHQEFKTFVKGINNLISIPVGLELAIYFLSACVTFQDPCEITVVFIVFTIALSLLFCYFGQYLIACNDSIEIALYNFTWHDTDIRNAKMVLLMLMNSQEPLKLTTLKVFDLKHTTFMSFVKMLYSTFSAFAVLNNSV